MRKQAKKLLCYMMVLAMTVTSISFVPVRVYANEANSAETAGWYLTDYKLIINTKKVTGSFSQGGNYSDIVSIFDTEGVEMTGLESDFENDILLRYGRYDERGKLLCGYDQAISWDSPEDYYAEGETIQLTNLSNLEVSHQTWSSRSISARFNLKTIHDSYSNKFVTGEGSDQFGIGSENITIKTEKAVSKGIRGEVAYLIINFNNSTSTDSQAIYKYVWKAPDNKLKAKSYKTEVNNKGWYLTGYTFENISNPYYESGSGYNLMIDTMTLYDGNGDRAENSKFLENDIYIFKERYLGAYLTESLGGGVGYEVKWNSPASYIAAGSKLKINNYSSQPVQTNGWGPASMHAYANTTGFSTEISDPSGNSWPEATSAVALISNLPLPEGTAEQILKVYLGYTGVGNAIYTYTWKTGESANPSVTKPKVTLYLVGADQTLTYQIGLINEAGYSVTYKSRKSSVASVNNKGVITAKKVGKANIIVTFKKGSKKYTKTIKVVVKNK